MAVRRLRGVAGALLALLLLGSPVRAAEKTIKLKFRPAQPQQRLAVPFERQLILAQRGADLRVGEGQRLQCRVVDREQVRADVDGDGGFGATVKRGEVLELTVQNATGEPLPHAIRMVNDIYGRPCLEPGGARVGKLKGTRIAVLDANLNGRYADYGQDLMVVGKLPYAFPLSPIVVVGRSLFGIRVHEDGVSLAATPLDEPLGKLDFASKLRGLKKPKMVVFRRTVDGAHDHVAAFRSPALLPAGEWTLAYAVFSDALWAVGRDDQAPIRVAAEPVRWTWGAPFHLVGKAAVRDVGTHRTFVPPAVLKAPKLIERKVTGKHVVIDFPPDVVGSAGVTYVGNWQHAGDGGVSLPDKKIAHFDVHIVQGGKQMNTDMPRWAPWDMSGLVQKVPVYWTSYDWPVGSLRGTLSISFACQSPLFGGALRSEPVDVEVK